MAVLQDLDSITKRLSGVRKKLQNALDEQQAQLNLTCAKHCVFT